MRLTTPALDRELGVHVENTRGAKAAVFNPFATRATEITVNELYFQLPGLEMSGQLYQGQTPQFSQSESPAGFPSLGRQRS